MFSEIVKGNGALSSDGLHMIYKGGATTPCSFTNDLDLSNDCQNKGNTFLDGSKGMQWPRYYMGRGGGYTHTLPPNKKSCVYSGVGSFPNLIGASSYHPGGVNVTFLDGSVKFIKNSVNYAAWHAIGSKAGNEVISSDAL